MARAKRHYLPGHVWHLTHRCHKKEFLLKFSRDRRRWTEWLFQAKKRYGLRVLNYMVTSNHIHLLVLDGGGRREETFRQIVNTARMVHKLKMGVNAGHGLDYKTIKAFKGVREIDEFSIGQSIIARAVREMVALIKEL